MTDPKLAAHRLHEVLTEMNEGKRVSLSDLRPNHHRTHPDRFQILFREAKTVGELFTAYQKIASSHGFHTDFTENEWAVIEWAKKLDIRIPDFPAVG